MDTIDCGTFSGSLATFLCISDCTPKHPFVDPAPAFEESPDLLPALSILHSTVLCGVVRLNHTDVSIAGKPTPRSSVTLRLNQAHGGFCQSRDQCNHESQLCCFIVWLVVSFVPSCSSFMVWGSVPWSYSRRRRRGRFAKNRSPPTSRWAVRGGQ